MPDRIADRGWQIGRMLVLVLCAGCASGHFPLGRGPAVSGPVWRFAGEAYVDDALVAESEFSAMIQEGTDDNGGASNSNR